MLACECRMLKQEQSHQSNSQNDEERDVEEDMTVSLDEFPTVVQEDALKHQSLLVHHQHYNEYDNEQGNHNQHSDLDPYLRD